MKVTSAYTKFYFQMPSHRQMLLISLEFATRTPVSFGFHGLHIVTNVCSAGIPRSFVFFSCAPHLPEGAIFPGIGVPIGLKPAKTAPIGLKPIGMITWSLLVWNQLGTCIFSRSGLTDSGILLYVICFLHIHLRKHS